MTGEKKSIVRPYILIIEDDEDIAQLLSYNLLKAGYNVLCAESGEEGLKILETENIDCVLLDLMLPGINGLEVCKHVKTSGKNNPTPIIMLTARSEDEDIVAGLECGADDYVPKPFSPKVLIARIKAVLRRKNTAISANGNREKIIRFSGLEINTSRHEVFWQDTLIRLTMTEFDILVLLADRPGWVFTRQQIIDSVRGYDFLVTPRAVDVQIFGLRKKLGQGGTLIETVRGLGYRCREE